MIKINEKVSKLVSESEKELDVFLGVLMMFVNITV